MKRTPPKSDRKMADQILQLPQEKLERDMLRWIEAGVTAILGLALRFVGVKVIVWPLLVAIVVLAPAVTRPWSWTRRHEYRQRAMVGSILVMWLVVVMVWPWWFSAPGRFGYRILTWPIWPAAALVWATLMVGWRAHIEMVSEDQAKKLDGRNKLVDMERALASGDLTELQEHFLPYVIEAGLLPKHTRLISTSETKRGRQWSFGLPRGHRGLSDDVTKPQFASFLHCDAADIRVSHAQANHSIYIVEQIQKPWPKKVPLPKLEPGVLRLGWFDTADPFSIALRSGQDALHMLISGMTGSGKSSAERQVIQEWICQRRFEAVELWLADPTGGSEFGPLFGWAQRKAKTAATCVELLVAAHEELERRYATMEGDDDDFESFSNIYDGHWLVVAVDEMPQVLDEDQAAVMAAMKAFVQRGRRVKMALECAQQSPRAKAMGGDAKTQFPTRFCFKVAEPAETNLALKQGCVGRGIDASKITEKGRAYLALQDRNDEPMAQFFLPMDFAELDALVPRKAGIGPWTGPVPTTVPTPGNDPVPTDRSRSSEPPVDVFASSEGTRERDEPELDLSVLDAMADDALTQYGVSAPVLYRTLADAWWSESDLARASGLSKGSSTSRPLAKMLEARLVHRDSEKRWARASTPLEVGQTEDPEEA